MQLIEMLRSKFSHYRRTWKVRASHYVNGSCFVLLYHRVTKLDSDPQMLSVTPENFYEQIKYLARYCTLLKVDDFIYIKKNKKKISSK
jgi:hypothetical protein